LNTVQLKLLHHGDLLSKIIDVYAFWRHSVHYSLNRLIWLEVNY